jgi:hypothetical protein
LDVSVPYEVETVRYFPLRSLLSVARCSRIGPFLFLAPHALTARAFFVPPPFPLGE